MGNSVANLIRFEVPPPGKGLVTVIVLRPKVATSAALIAEVSCVLEINVVGRAPEFHCTTEVLTNPEPFTVSVKDALPCGAPSGVMEERAGDGFVIVKAGPFPMPEAPGVTTAMVAVPAVAISAALIAACNWLLETKVVGRALPFHWTTEVAIKPAPSTLRVKVPLPASIEVGDIDVICG